MKHSWKSACPIGMAIAAMVVCPAHLARAQQVPGGELPQVSVDFSFSETLPSGPSPSLKNPSDGAELSLGDASRVPHAAEQTSPIIETSPVPSKATSPTVFRSLEIPQVAEALDFSQFAAPEDEPPIADETAILTQPWWLADDSLSDMQRPGQAWELERLIWLAVENSPFIKAVLVEPQIHTARAVATTGVFDPTAFVDSIFHDTSDPVGNTLITGTANRFNEHFWENRSGIRSKNQRGGQAELAQEFNFKDNNSDFFIPRNQSDTKMVLRYSQPLMRGAGVDYNCASYVVASLRANESTQEAAREIQDHAFSITNAYWELYAARAQYAQIARGMHNLTKLRNQLERRADIDSLRSQLLRADAAIAAQNANSASAVSQIRSAEANLRAAVAAPMLLQQRDLAVIPATPPSDWRGAVNPQHELGTALNLHPEIQALRAALQASRVRLQVAENELRPTLDLVLEGYIRGLNGDFDAAKSFGDQFSTGAPSYSAGLAYARPYRNVTAKAILRERRLELRRTLLELDHTLLSVGADVESAIARIEAAYVRLESDVQATLATHHELQYLQARLNNAFLDATATSVLLDQTLAAEIRLIESENDWARSQADHMIAIASLRLATGSLLPMLTPEQF